MKKVLRHGYTTGACSAAAAKGAAMMLRDQKLLEEISILLPTGQSVCFSLHGQSFSGPTAACYVIKDAGDDPDVTHGAEIHANVTLTDDPQEEGNIIISGGTGIGKATKPGLAVAPGEYAINPVPRRMITESVRDVFNDENRNSILVTISIPDGELRANKTLNARLGILGGLSILGTTGIVRPVSAKAWTDTIDAALDVAKACNCRTVVFSTGRTSEMAAQNHLNTEECENLAEEAYIMMGDHVAHALRSAVKHGFTRPIVACQFAKLVKIACGYENTHAAASEMDLKLLLQLAEKADMPAAILDSITNANTAREIAVASNFEPELLRITSRKAFSEAQRHAPGISPVFMVADYTNKIVFSYCE